MKISWPSTSEQRLHLVLSMMDVLPYRGVERAHQFWLRIGIGVLSKRLFFFELGKIR